MRNWVILMMLKFIIINIDMIIDKNVSYQFQCSRHDFVLATSIISDNLKGSNFE